MMHSVSSNFNMPLISSLSTPPQCSVCHLAGHHYVNAVGGTNAPTHNETTSLPSDEMDIVVEPTLPSASPSTTLWLLPELTAAIIDVMLEYEWGKAFYIYDTTDGLNRLEQLHKAMFDRPRQVRTIEVESVRLVNTTICHDTLRRLDRRAPAKDKHFIMDLSTAERLQSVLQQVHSLGMNRAGYHYILTTHAMESLDLTSFRYGGVNITGFSLQQMPSDWVKSSRTATAASNIVTDDLPQYSLQSALTTDAIMVIGHGLRAALESDVEKFRNYFRRGELYNDVKCQGQGHTSKPWIHGPIVREFLRQLRFEGQTGLVAFDSRGHRKDFTLSVLEQSVDDDIRKIGVWNYSSGLNISRQTTKLSSSSVVEENLNRTMIITSIISPPYLMLRKSPDEAKERTGNDRFEGYCADLANELSQRVNFKYQLKLVEDGKFGTNESGKWNGMVGELIDRKADLAIAPLTITSQRERVIDFSKPFMELGISIMIKKPEKLKPGVFSFMAPLSSHVWICIVVSYVGVSMVLFLVSRFSPYEWQIEDKMAGLSYTNDFTILNSLWFALGAFMRQGCDISPRSVSGRIVGSAWWFFTLIIISSYTANLAAFLTVERMLTPIESADDLAKQRDIQYGTLKGGSTEDFFRTSRIPTYQQMWEFMKNAQPTMFVSTTEMGVERVRNSKGKYAFLLESPMNEYHNQKKPCNTMKVGGNLDSKGYGVATPIDADLRDPIGVAILSLMEEGWLQKHHKKWWYDKGECIVDDGKSSGSSQNALTLSNVAGVFYILIIGLCVSLVFALLEFAYKSHRKTARHRAKPGI